MPSLSRPRLALRVAGVLLCSTAFLAVLGGGTCVWVTDDDDEHCFDDDDDNDVGCDDDDDDFESTLGPGASGPSSALLRERLTGLSGGIPVDGRATRGDAPAAPGPLGFGALAGEPGDATLTDYAVDLATEPGRHPVARVRDIRGVSVFALEKLGVVGADDFSRFTQRLVDENPDLLGLPPGAGHLRPRRVHFLDGLVAVVHEQVPGAPGDPWAAPLEDAEVVFAFDLLGRLLQVENRAVLPPGAVVTLPGHLLDR